MGLILVESARILKIHLCTRIILKDKTNEESYGEQRC